RAMNAGDVSSPSFAAESVTQLASPAPGCEVWLCDLENVHATDAMAVSLSVPERARAARFGADLLRNRWIAGRATLRSLLGLKLGIEPQAVQLRSGRRGRPELATPSNLDFNVSHTQGIAIIAIADGMRSGTRIGVDIERVDRTVNADGLARKFLTERERAALAPLDADMRRRS